MNNNNINEQNGIIKNNSEILFIYDAKMCNPNGDPDDENKPRMDYDRNINLVSDVRLKRYIRDYLINYKLDNNDKPLDIFITKIDNETVSATKRLEKLIENHREEIKNNINLKYLFTNEDKPDEKALSNYTDWLLSKLIDVRYFGATMTIKAGDTGKGAQITFTGPIQFNWGYSLNKVLGVIESNTITSTFAGASEEHSTIGKDYRVGYSIIAFHGIISANRALYTNLTDDDIKIFDESMIKAIPLEATSRSKIGQKPLLYIRIEYNNSEFLYGDLRRYVNLVDNENKEIPFEKSYKLDWDKYKLDLSCLTEKIKDIKTNIFKVHFWKNDDMKIYGWDEIENLEYNDLVWD